MSRFLFIAFLFAQSIQTSLGADPRDSLIRGPKYEVIVQDLSKLTQEFPGEIQVVRYDSAQATSQHHIVIIKSILNQTFNQPTPAVLITGATHGNEYLNIADRLPRWFLENKNTNANLKQYFDKGGVVYIVPIYNTYGYDRLRRRNARNVDLNRDFPLIPLDKKNRNEIETRDFLNYFEAEITQSRRNLKLALDYHCCQGSLLYPWSYTRNPLPQDKLAAHKDIASIVTFHFGYPSGTTFDMLGYLPEGTSKDYYYAKYGALAFTFEGEQNKEDQKFHLHTLMWEEILGRF